MLFTPFNKSWWKTLAKGDPGQEIPVVSVPEDEMDDEGSTQLSKPVYPNENIVNEESDSDQGEEEPFVHEGGQTPGSSEVDAENPYDLKGFELEQDEPSQEGRSRDKRPVRRGAVQSPRDFFSDDLQYRYDLIEEPERSALKGSYRLELKGQQGGVWTVRIGDAVEVLNRREDADVVFSVQQGDFMKLVNGQLNPQIAVLSKKLRVTGDLKQAMAFNSVICPSDD